MPLKNDWTNGQSFTSPDQNAVATQVNTNTTDISGLTSALGAKQASDSDLTAIAAIAPANNDVIQRKAGAWTNRTPAQLKTDLAIGTSDVSGLTTALDGKQDSSLRNQANGYAGLDSVGKVPAAQLPSYVDDVLEFASLAGFPVTGETGKIYIAIDSGKTYRWSGSVYAVISETLAIGTTSSTAKAGDYQPAWSEVIGKPAVIAAGADQAAARTAIGAGTSSLTLGSSGSTAAAGNDSRLSDARTPTDGSVTTTKIAAATLVTAAEGISSNNNDTTIPTSAAVKAYADSVGGGGGGGGGTVDSIVPGNNIDVDNTDPANPVVSVEALTADDFTDGTTNKAFLASERSKLVGIESLADVTDMANVTAAGAEMVTRKNATNGYAGLDGSGLIPSALLPSYVDDVIEAPNLGALPSTGVTGKIYVTLDSNKTYRWSGSAYVEISASPGSTDAVTEGVTNLYFTNSRADARVAAGITAKADDTAVVKLTGAQTIAGAKQFTSAIDLASNKITNLLDPTNAQDGATKAYVDSKGGGAAFLSGLYSALPAAGTSGRYYMCTDVDALFYDNGTVWSRVRIGNNGPGPLADVPSTGWTTTTLGTATVAADRDGRLLTVPSTAGNNVRGEYRTLTPTSNYTLTVNIEISAYDTNYISSGLMLRDATGKYISFGPTYTNGMNLGSQTYGSQSAFNSNYRIVAAYAYTRGLPTWLRIRDNGTNRIMEWSYNGLDWVLFHSVGRTDYFTPNAVGWFIDNSSGQTTFGRLRSWSLV